MKEKQGSPFLDLACVHYTYTLLKELYFNFNKAKKRKHNSLLVVLLLF